MPNKNGALLRQLRHLYWATLTLFLAGVALGLFVFIDSGSKRGELASQQRALAAQQVKLATLAKTTNGALCNLRHELELRLAAAEAYLARTPHAIPGITPAQIRTDIANRRSSIASLSDLRCGSPSKRR